MTNNFNFKHSISKIKNMNINKLDIDIKRIFQKNIVIKVEKDNKIN